MQMMFLMIFDAPRMLVLGFCHLKNQVFWRENLPKLESKTFRMPGRHDLPHF